MCHMGRSKENGDLSMAILCLIRTIQLIPAAKNKRITKK